MGPKFDPTEVRIGELVEEQSTVMRSKYINFKYCLYQVKYVYLRAVGGEVGATSSLAPKVTEPSEQLLCAHNTVSILFSSLITKGWSTWSVPQKDW